MFLKLWLSFALELYFCIVIHRTLVLNFARCSQVCSIDDLRYLISGEFTNQITRNNDSPFEILVKFNNHFMCIYIYLSIKLSITNLIKCRKCKMATSTYFCLVIWITSLIQLPTCQSPRPNIIMIVADDLVSWKFVFSMYYNSNMYYDDVS